MESLKENSVLQTLTKIFNSYVYREKRGNPEIKSLTKKSILQIFYDYNVIDTCGYNILHLNEFIHQLIKDIPSVILEGLEKKIEDQSDLKSLLKKF